MAFETSVNKSGAKNLIDDWLPRHTSARKIATERQRCSPNRQTHKQTHPKATARREWANKRRSTTAAARRAPEHALAHRWARAPVGTSDGIRPIRCTARHMKGLTLKPLACPPNGGAKERAQLGAWWQVRRAHAHARPHPGTYTPHASSTSRAHRRMPWLTRCGRAAAGFTGCCSCS